MSIAIEPAAALPSEQSAGEVVLPPSVGPAQSHALHAMASMPGQQPRPSCRGQAPQTGHVVPARIWHECRYRACLHWAMVTVAFHMRTVLSLHSAA